MLKDSERFIFKGNTIPVDNEDLEQVDKYLAGGFLKIAICEHGIGRSFKYAEEECRKGIGTVFLEGGLEGLAEQMDQMANSENKWKIIRSLRAFPDREFLLDYDEVKKYLDYIYKIGGCIVRADPKYESK